MAHSSNKKLLVLFTLLGIILGAGVTFLINRDTEEKPPVYEGALGWRTNEALHEEGGDAEKYSITIKYPQIEEGVSAEVKSIINSAIKAKVNSYADVQRDNLEKTAQELSPDWEAELFFNAAYTETKTASDYWSIVFIMSLYGGGAHPITWHETSVFDLKTGRILSVSDVFDSSKDYLSTISRFALAEIKEKDPDLLLYSFAEEGTSPKSENFDAFSLSDTGVNFYFDDYQVGSYAAGPLSIEIPYENLRGVMKAGIR